MSSSLSSPTIAGRVLLAADTAALPLASLLSPQTIALALGTDDDGADEAAIAAQVKAAYEQGHEDGMNEARDTEARLRQERLTDCSRRLAEAVTAFAAARDTVLSQIVAESVDLTFGLLHELVGAELSLHESPAREAVLRALELTPPDKDLIVRVHPESELALADLQDEIPSSGVAIVLDPAVELTGAVVEAGACRIDAQVGPALERVRDLLVAQLSQQRAHA